MNGGAQAGRLRHATMAVLVTLLAAAGYLVGSIPFGLLIARAKGVDIRTQGSGNIGATNVGRVMGKRFGLLCFGLDFLKGLAPSLAGGAALGTLGSFAPPSDRAWLWMLVAVSPILGHVFPVWLGFKGGKGVATGFGALAGAFPVVTIAAVGAFLAWFACLKVTRYVGLSSCIAAVVLPVLVGVTGLVASRRDPAAGGLGGYAPFLTVTGLLALLVLWTHRGNLARTLAGTERRVGEPRDGGASPAGTAR